MLSNSETTKTTYVKMFSKEPGTDDANAFFGISEKVDGKWTTTKRFDTIEGFLSSVSVGEFEFKGVPKKTLKMVFMDESGERVQIESTFTLLAYNVINTLAGADLSKKLKMKLYVSTRKDTCEKRASIYIECGGEKAAWRYAPEDLPKIVKVMVGKKEVIDDTDVVTFYENLANSLSLKLVADKAANPMAALPDSGLSAMHAIATSHAKAASAVPTATFAGLPDSGLPSAQGTERSFNKISKSIQPSAKEESVLAKIGAEQVMQSETQPEEDDLPF